MKDFITLHPVQLNIVKKLLFKPKAKYSELNVTKMTTDHFNFHVKKLIKEKLILKNETGLYELTKTGKEFANRFDTNSETNTHAKQAKIGILVGCVRKNKGIEEYLIQQRLKQPFFGIYGFMSGKVNTGETIEESAKRGLYEETRLSGKLKIVGVMHKMDYDINSSLLEDKVFFIFKGTQLKGEFIEKSKNGINKWMSKKDFLRLPKKSRFESTPSTMRILDKESFLFFEKKYVVEGF